MARHPKTGLQSFDSAWQQTVSWAQSQGIGPSAYLPVYQLDATRLQNGQYPMGRAERNLSILAAHNPNAVTSVPQDNPNPTNVFSNAVNDAGKIATGLIGIFTGTFERQVWDSARSTIHAIIDPASMDAPTFGGTIGNWLDNTLLSYVPGMADIGQVLHADPTLTGSAGFRALAQHPLLSVLDLIPGAEGGLARGARLAGATELAARLNGYSQAQLAEGAARAGMSVSDYAKTLKPQSAAGAIAKQIGGIKIGGKPGVTMRNEWREKLSVNERLQKIVAKTPGVGPAIGDLMEHLNTSQSYGENQWIWLMGNFADNLTKLGKDDPKAAAKVSQVLNNRDISGGDTVVNALRDPTLSPLGKEVIRQALEIGRYETDASVVRGGLAGIWDNAGRLGFWSRTGDRAEKVLGARQAMDRSRGAALEAIGTLEPLAERLAGMHDALPVLANVLQSKSVEARRALFNDPKFQRIIQQAGSKATIRTGAELRAVFDQGGFIDDAVKTLRENPKPGDVVAVAEAIIHRLSKWGPGSVRATEAPEMGVVYQAALALKQWGESTRKLEAEIDRHIRGEVEATKFHAAERKEYNDARMRAQKEQHAHERAKLKEATQAKKGARTASYSQRIMTLHAEMIEQIGLIKQQTELAEVRGAGETVLQQRARIAAAVKEENRRIRDLNRAYQGHVRSWTKSLKEENKKDDLKYERDRARLAHKHDNEKRALRRQVAQERLGYGSLVREMDKYGKAIHDFHQAVMDYPADIYRNPFLELYRNRLKALEDTAAAKIATDRYLSDMEKDRATKAEVDKIRNNPDYLAEYMAEHWAQIMGQPNLDPELRQFAEEEMAACREDANEQLKQLIGQGYKVPYIPTASPFDVGMGRHSLFPIIGRGILKPDIEKAKVWDFTAQKEDFAVGLNKAALQEIQRATQIHLVDTVLKPLTMTGTELSRNIHLTAALNPAGRLAEGFGPGELSGELSSIMLRELNLREFDPEALFGFRLPRWGTEKLYMPAPLIDAMEKAESVRRSDILAKSNKVFRYSILGLSPRYDAHVVFGGTLMLALRSSPAVLNPTLIAEAWRMMRDRTMPAGLGHPVEEGVQLPEISDKVKAETEVLRMFGRYAGRDLHNMEIGEHIEVVQKVSRYAAKPIHVIRAAADINFRFVRYVRDLQYSIALLDGVAKYEKRHGGRIEIEDPETGKMIHVTPERALNDAMHHVEQVYGNLNRMSPFERQVAQTVMPFYGWQRHVLGYVLSFPFDHPYRALILSQLAWNASNQVPLAYPLRIQFLHFLGAPDKNGNINAIDLRSLDPFRDVANYATWTGFFESLNPALAAPLAMAFGPQAVYGESSLYPNVTYNAFYGIQTATAGGSLVTGLEQFVPQIGAAQSALASMSGVRSTWQTNRGAAIKTLLEAMNIPFVTPPVNLRQVAAKTEAARFESANKAAYAAFTTGDFSKIAGYKTVPYPLNTAYQVTPAQLEAIYNQALQTTPGVAPIESLLPPPTPYGW